ncbi:EXOC3L1 [Cervus elaphus hippelaphus]|uniref:EXOC3L1 n=1 Tax=Cervus elaphus hippelaphus TaxID=46360 RepID=A0A212DE94_CEREH|nr:EXOC3L1 [Cervus elaphus hippelaphus]
MADTAPPALPGPTPSPCARPSPCVTSVGSRGLGSRRPVLRSGNSGGEKRIEQGLEESVQCAPVLLALRELLNLRDPTLLGLEVAGLRQQFPDVRCEDGEDHVSALLDLRGDVSREQRLAALSSLRAGPQPSPPAGRRALFSLVPTPAPSLASCFPSGSCA